MKIVKEAFVFKKELSICDIHLDETVAIDPDFIEDDIIAHTVYYCNGYFEGRFNLHGSYALLIIKDFNGMVYPAYIAQIANDVCYIGDCSIQFAELFHEVYYKTMVNRSNHIFKINKIVH